MVGAYPRIFPLHFPGGYCTVFEGMEKFGCVSAVASSQNGDGLADVSVDGADAQTQFEGDFLGALKPIDMAEAFALARCQAFAESDAQLLNVTNRQVCAACRLWMASPLRYLKQHLLFSTRALLPDGFCKRPPAHFVNRAGFRLPLNFTLTRE